MAMPPKRLTPDHDDTEASYILDQIGLAEWDDDDEWEEWHESDDLEGPIPF
jgi:hypothetical protein